MGASLLGRFMPVERQLAGKADVRLPGLEWHMLVGSCFG